MIHAPIELHFDQYSVINKSLLLFTITVPDAQVEEGLSGWLELEATAGRRTERLAGLHRSMSLLKEAEVNPSHRLHRCSRIF
jgi:hypothetical protein